jgi:hypothetical protein
MLRKRGTGLVRISGAMITAMAVAVLSPPTSGGTVPVRSASELRSGIGLVRWGGGSGPSNNWRALTNMNRYSVVLVGAANAPAAAGLPGRSLLYACGVNVPTASWSGTCGVSWTTAVAKGWILKDASGNYASFDGGDGFYLADVGNPSYQRAWLGQMLALLHRYRGIDGVLIDNVIGSTIYPPDPPATYPDNASYRAAMKSFMDYVGPALQAKGYYVDVNASMIDTTTPGWQASFGNQCDGSQFIWWYHLLARDVRAFTTESWEMNWDSSGSIRLSGTASCDQNWDGWQRLVARVQGMGKDFIPLTSGPGDAGGVAKSTYLKASFLLDYNGGTSAFVYAAGGPTVYSGSADDWMGGAPWTYNLGRATGGKTRVGVGWRRDFRSGTVVLNPNPVSSQTFPLAATYILPDGSRTTAVTLDPGSALILRLAGGRRP